MPCTSQNSTPRVLSTCKACSGLHPMLLRRCRYSDTSPPQASQDRDDLLPLLAASARTQSRVEASASVRQQPQKTTTENSDYIKTTASICFNHQITSGSSVVQKNTTSVDKLLTIVGCTCCFRSCGCKRDRRRCTAPLQRMPSLHRTSVTSTNKDCSCNC